jgi:hypothetical protein
MNPCTLRRICAALFFAAIAAVPAELWAQDTSPPDTDRPGHGRPGIMPRFTRQAFLLEINARIIERDNEVSWNEVRTQVTDIGRAVEIRLLGDNLAVVAQFTPYMGRGAGYFIVAQGQVWMDTEGQGVRYQASMQTIPVEIGEAIHFLPLGPAREGTASIELILTVRMYDED